MIGVVAEIVIVVVVSVELAIDVLLVLMRLLEPSVTPSTSCVRLVRAVVRRRLRSAILFLCHKERNFPKQKLLICNVHQFGLYCFFFKCCFVSEELVFVFFCFNFGLNFRIRNEYTR